MITCVTLFCGTVPYVTILKFRMLPGVPWRMVYRIDSEQPRVFVKTCPNWIPRQFFFYENFVRRLLSELLKNKVSDLWAMYRR